MSLPVFSYTFKVFLCQFHNGQSRTHPFSCQNPVEFTSNGIKEALNQPHKYMRAKNGALADIVELLKEGVHVLERPDDKGNAMVAKYHYIRIRIAGEDSFAVIRELKDGRCQFYSIVERLKRKESD